MEWDRLKAGKAAAIVRLQAALEDIPRESAPKFGVAAAVLSSALLTVTYQTVVMILGCLKLMAGLTLTLVVAPFIYLYFIVDISLVIIWHSLNVYRRMTGGKDA